MKRKWLTAIAAVILFWSLAGAGQVQAKSKYIIYVNRSSNIVNVVRRSSGKVVRSMWCSTGVGYATPSGTFYTGEKYRWRSLYHNSAGQYCTRINGHILFHSVPAAGYSKTAVPTRAFNLLGTQASMGCVRLACKDARWIYNNCSYGTKVIIGESRKMKKPLYKRIKVSTKRYYYWDPTDPDPSNPYRPKIRLSKEGKKKLYLGSRFDIRKMVIVSSPIGSQKLIRKHIRMTGKVNTKKPGKYKVKVKVTDPKSELSREKSFTFRVSKKTAPPEQPAAVTPEGKELPADKTEAAKKTKLAKAGVAPEAKEERAPAVQEKTDGTDARIAKARETIRKAKEEIKKAKAEIKKARADQKKAAKKKAKTKKKNKPAKKKAKAKKKNKPAKKKSKPAKKKSKAKKKDKPAKKKAK